MTPDQKTYFQTNDLTESIGRESVRGSALALTSDAIATAVRLGTLLIMARLLSPYEFGIFGMAMVPMAFLAIFQQFGFSTAIVQYPDLRHEHASQLFWFNLRWNALLVALTIASIPIFVAYFGEDGLVGLALVGIAGLFAAGVTNIHAGLLRRRMHFGVLAAAKITTSGAGAVVGLALAMGGAKQWALVSQFLVIHLATSLIRLAACPWRPARPQRSDSLRDTAVRDLLEFGRNALTVRVLDQFTTQLQMVIVGRVSGVGVLGLYQNAQRWARLPIEQLGALRQVAIGAMSRLANERERRRNYTRAVWLWVCSLVFPIFGLIILDTRTIIELMLGAKWLDAAPFLRPLAVGMAAECVMRILTWVLFADGRTRELVRWSWGRAVILVIGMSIGVPWGPQGIATGYAIAAWMYLVPTLVVLTHEATYINRRDVAVAVGRPLLATLSAGMLWLLISMQQDAAITLGDRLSDRTALYPSFVIGYAAAWAMLPGAHDELRRLFSIARDQAPSD